MRYEDALAAYDQALRCASPDYPEAFNNRGEGSQSQAA